MGCIPGGGTTVVPQHSVTSQSTYEETKRTLRSTTAANAEWTYTSSGK